MKRNALLAALTGLILVQIGLWAGVHRPAGPISPVVWFGFLVVLPIGLAAIVAMRLRWAAMACVIYGTVGLALDLATAVQIVTADGDPFPALIGSGLSAVLNFLLIAFGGQEFLDVVPGRWPPESRPPSPPAAS